MPPYPLGKGYVGGQKMVEGGAEGTGSADTFDNL